jgi:S-adenosylmethionine synthetase
VQYVNNKPVGCTKVVVSTQHNEQNRNGKKYTPGMVKDLIGNAVESGAAEGLDAEEVVDFLVNPTGNFVVGGPDGDCGLTGRKIIVDTYGGYAPHGGGAFSGKDPTKVDRSAAYAARYLAKNVVAAGLADAVHDPDRLRDRRRRSDVGLVDTHGTGKVDERKLDKVLPEIFRLTPTNIRRSLKLNRPIYRAPRLRPLRPRAGEGRRLLLGADQPGRRAQERVQVSDRHNHNCCDARLVPGIVVLMDRRL